MRFPPTGHKPVPNPADLEWCLTRTTSTQLPQGKLMEGNGSCCGCSTQSTTSPFPLGGNPSSSPLS